jgi:DNA-binding response OmpR family regulator
MNLPQNLLLLGKVRPERKRSLTGMAAAAKQSLIAIEEPAEALTWLESNDAACLVVDAGVTRLDKIVAKLRSKPHLSHVPVFALVQSPDDLWVEQYFAWGGDDIVPVDAGSSLLERLKSVPREAPKPSPGRSVVVADPDPSRGELIARAFAQAGCSVMTVTDRARLEQIVKAESPTVVVANAALGELAELILQLRKNRSRSGWVVLAARRELELQQAALAPLERCVVVGIQSSPWQLLYRANEVARSTGAERRAHPRWHVGTAVLFRAAGSEEDDVGVCYDLSTSGMFIRTFAPLVAEQVWIEWRIPGDKTRVRLEGEVVWRQISMTDPARPCSPMGFGVRFADYLGAAKGHLERAIETLENAGRKSQTSLPTVSAVTYVSGLTKPDDVTVPVVGKPVSAPIGKPAPAPTLKPAGLAVGKPAPVPIGKPAPPPAPKPVGLVAGKPAAPLIGKSVSPGATGTNAPSPTEEQPTLLRLTPPGQKLEAPKAPMAAMAKAVSPSMPPRPAGSVVAAPQRPEKDATGRELPKPPELAKTFKTAAESTLQDVEGPSSSDQTEVVRNPLLAFEAEESLPEFSLDMSSAVEAEESLPKFTLDMTSRVAAEESFPKYTSEPPSTGEHEDSLSEFSLDDAPTVITNSPSDSMDFHAVKEEHTTERYNPPLVYGSAPPLTGHVSPPLGGGVSALPASSVDDEFAPIRRKRASWVLLSLVGVLVAVGVVVFLILRSKPGTTKNDFAVGSGAPVSTLTRQTETPLGRASSEAAVNGASNQEQTETVTADSGGDLPGYPPVEEPQAGKGRLLADRYGYLVVRFPEPAFIFSENIAIGPVNSKIATTCGTKTLRIGVGEKPTTYLSDVGEVKVICRETTRVIFRRLPGVVAPPGALRPVPIGAMASDVKMKPITDSEQKAKKTLNSAATDSDSAGKQRESTEVTAPAIKAPTSEEGVVETRE